MCGSPVQSGIEHDASDVGQTEGEQTGSSMNAFQSLVREPCGLERGLNRKIPRLSFDPLY